MIVYIYNIGVDLYNGFNGLRHRINWTYFTVLDGLAHPLYSIITTNINFGEWDDIFGDPVIANAIVDRILHHAKVVTINGKSYRLKDHLIKKENND